MSLNFTSGIELKGPQGVNVTSGTSKQPNRNTAPQAQSFNVNLSERLVIAPEEIKALKELHQMTCPDFTTPEDLNNNLSTRFALNPQQLLDLYQRKELFSDEYYQIMANGIEEKLGHSPSEILKNETLKTQFLMFFSGKSEAHERQARRFPNNENFYTYSFSPAPIPPIYIFLEDMRIQKISMNCSETAATDIATQYFLFEMSEDYQFIPPWFAKIKHATLHFKNLGKEQLKLVSQLVEANAQVSRLILEGNFDIREIGKLPNIQKFEIRKN